MVKSFAAGIIFLIFRTEASSGSWYISDAPPRGIRFFKILIDKFLCLFVPFCVHYCGVIVYDNSFAPVLYQEIQCAQQVFRFKAGHYEGQAVFFRSRLKNIASRYYTYMSGGNESINART